MCLDRNRETIAAQPVTDPPCSSNGESLAYVMYTSGSTGRPKGVAVPLRGVLRLTVGVDYAQLDEQQTFLLLSPISFDASTFELWAGLLHGGRCAIFPEPVPTIEKLREALERYRVTTLFLTTALFNLVVDEAPQILRGVRQLLSGGEAVSPAHVRAALQGLPDTQLIHCYGPTESTTFTCCYRIPNPMEESNLSIPIGRPIANTRVYVLDRHLNPVPLGVAGELCIAGDGLARGYLNRPELTAERFVPDPFSTTPGARMYRTGDLVRYRSDANIEFLGRLDDQVKIRGFRVEPGEVMAVLHEHPDVKQAVVIAGANANDERALIAYIVPENSETGPDAQALRRFLFERVPQYMVPAEFLTIESIPLTLTGKLDRARLPAVDRSETRTTQQRIMPRTPIEQILADLWCLSLNIDSVGIDDNFFELGGDSLAAMRLVARILRETGLEVHIRTLFDKPTIRTLAGALSERMPGNEQAVGRNVAF
jgi:amino acid adenylation domain-containing protein